MSAGPSNTSLPVTRLPGPSNALRPPPHLPDGEDDGVRVVYAVRAGANAADDRIVELVASDPAPAGVRVVTSDRALQARVRGLGAQVVSTREWLRRLDATAAP